MKLTYTNIKILPVIRLELYHNNNNSNNFARCFSTDTCGGNDKPLPQFLPENLRDVFILNEWNWLYAYQILVPVIQHEYWQAFYQVRRITGTRKFQEVAEVFRREKQESGWSISHRGPLLAHPIIILLFLTRINFIECFWLFEYYFRRNTTSGVTFCQNVVQLFPPGWVVVTNHNGWVDLAHWHPGARNVSTNRACRRNLSGKFFQNLVDICSQIYNITESDVVVKTSGETLVHPIIAMCYAACKLTPEKKFEFLQHCYNQNNRL